MTKSTLNIDHQLITNTFYPEFVVYLDRIRIDKYRRLPKQSFVLVLAEVYIVLIFLLD